MARHKISEAAKMVGKHRKSIYRHIKQGRVSSHTGDDGEKYIDTSELIRVYGKIETPETGFEIARILENETPETAKLLRELISIVKHQSDQLEAIKNELEKRPRIENKTTTEGVSQAKKPDPEPSKHSYSDIIKRLKEKSK